jgi:uncharacterized protein YjbI with pentapeptide repeats
MNFMKIWNGAKSGESDWMEQLLALNPWAGGLTIGYEVDKEFEAARQKATLERWAQGRKIWNDWANGMLAVKNELQKTGKWTEFNGFPWEDMPQHDEPRLHWDTLSHAVFSTDHDRHTFEGDLRTDKCVFPGRASFQGATFSGTAWFDQATFPSHAVFDRATFSGPVSFAHATVSGTASFEGATFSGRASFASATFSGTTSFSHGTFSGDALFAYARFKGDVLVAGATFSGVAVFDHATFSGYAGFYMAAIEFKYDEGFFRYDSVIFSDIASFQGATFRGDALFDNVTFSGDALFKDATFSRDAKFAGAAFSRATNFESSSFKRRANFDAVKSEGAFSLADATFGQVPSLLGATFRGTLRLDNVRTPRFRLTLGFTRDKDAPARFRELKRRANEAQDRDRELEFFAQEIRTSRFLTWGKNDRRKVLPIPRVWGWRFWFGALYGTFSNFGRSFGRPILFWSALCIVSWLFYLSEHEKAAQSSNGAFQTLVAYYLTSTSVPSCLPKGGVACCRFG